MSLYATDSNGKLHKIAGNGIGDISVVDAQLDIKSTNPVQNKVLYEPVSFAEEERVLSTKNLWDTYTMSNKQFKNTVFTTWGRYRILLKNNNSDGSILEINTTVGHGLYGVHTFKTKDTPVSFALQLSGLKRNTEYTITLLNFYQVTGVGSFTFCDKQFTNFGEDTTHVATFTTNAQGTYVFENGIVINSSNARVSLGDIMLEEGGVFTKYVVPMGRPAHELDIINFKEENKPDTELSNTSTKPVQNKVLYAPVSFAESERLKSKNLFDVNCYRVVDGAIAFKYHLQKGKTYTFSSNKPITQFKISNHTWGYYYAQKETASGFTKYTFTPTRPPELAEETEVFIFISLVNNFSQITKIDDLDGYEIQIEEGAVVTDYQPYNGAIVHEKDVADVERVETVYDKNSSDSAINWGYTSGLATNIDIQHNFNKYKKLLIYYVVKDGVYSFEKCFKMDLTENVSGVGFVVTQSEKNPYGWMADIAAFNEYYFVRCRVDSNKSLINVEFKKGTSNGISVSTVSEIYKIEGVY
jgi:hypothetical protein